MIIERCKYLCDQLKTKEDVKNAAPNTICDAMKESNGKIHECPEDAGCPINDDIQTNCFWTEEGKERWKRKKIFRSLNCTGCQCSDCYECQAANCDICYRAEFATEDLEDMYQEGTGGMDKCIKE